jgi:hypothetical protein
MRSLLCFILALVVCLIPASAQAATVTVPLHSDTFVRSDQPTTNFSAVNPLQVDGQVVGNPAEPERQSYLYFPNTPANVTSAKLRLHIPFPTAEGFQVRSITCQGWTAGGVTYNTRPALGAVLANVPPATANVYNDITLPALPNGSNCLALTKTGSNWMTVSSGESANPPQLVVETQPPPPTDTDGDGVPDVSDLCSGTPAGTTVDASGCPVTTPPPSPVAKCTGPVVDVTPSTIRSVITGRDNVIVRAAPGVYSDIGLNTSNVRGCMEIRCAVAAKSGDFGRTGSAGCVATGQNDYAGIRNLTVENFQFTTSEDYGVGVYDESPIVGMKVRFANNVWNGQMLHDLSTKENTDYVEVVDNYFISCMRHCWEINQNGNILNRPNTGKMAVFRGNKVTSRINGLTRRYTVALLVENNEFRGEAGYAVTNHPYWTLYPFPAPGDLYVPGTLDWSGHVVPYVPLRTTVRNNTFSGGGSLRFNSEGVTDDVILVQGNSGSFGCARGTMDSQDGGTSAAHINEQTTAPPKLDPASDTPC